MRFLADAGISPKTVEFLRLRGHDTVHVRDLALQRATDREIASKARADSRVLLTFDLDFGEILALSGRSPDYRAKRTVMPAGIGAKQPPKLPKTRFGLPQDQGLTEGSMHF